jgi:hypothetical protein
MPITPGTMGGMGAPANFSASPISAGRMGGPPRRLTGARRSPITPGVLGGGGVAPPFASPIAPGTMGDTSFRRGLGNRFDAAVGAMSQPSPITPGVLGGGGVGPAPVSPISPGGMPSEPSRGGFSPITPGTMGGMGAAQPSPITPGMMGGMGSEPQTGGSFMPWQQQHENWGGFRGQHPGWFGGGSPMTPGMMGGNRVGGNRGEFNPYWTPGPEYQWNAPWNRPGGGFSPGAPWNQPRLPGFFSGSPITPGFMGGRIAPPSPIIPGMMGG